jgi:hypothetical protein
LQVLDNLLGPAQFARAECMQRERWWRWCMQWRLSIQW